MGRQAVLQCQWSALCMTAMPLNGERYSSSYCSNMDLITAFLDWLSRLRSHAITWKLSLQGQSSVSLRRT